ncbi:MAG: penicillin-binding transpeptidase domain-containing protein [Eubacteriales bacterium]|nr:penicillin-binding transpeptidase domain-containing protein [Eubacteriales bacterium]MDD4541207.1 penicillin-binding transpeptidase domain-containing protein [Eubacteriales bacterium]
MSRRKDKITSLRKFKKAPTKPVSKLSLIAVFVFFLFAAVLIASRLYQLQIVQSEELTARAARQQHSVTRIDSKRGSILDRNGFPMVSSSYVYRVGMTPSVVSSRNSKVDQEDIADMVISCLNLDEDMSDRVRSLITVDENSSLSEAVLLASDRESIAYVQLAAYVPESKAERLEKWLKENNVGGFRFDAEEKRIYNNVDLASPVLGMTRAEAEGLIGVSGLEASYDDLLTGSTTYIYQKRNNYLTQGAVPFSSSIKQEGSSSQTLYSTIDSSIQSILHEELLSIAAATGSINGVSGIIMDLYTGDILAMDQIPSYRSDHPTALPLGLEEEYWNSLSEDERTKYRSENLWTNYNVSASYEPGSTFKTVTLAIGLEEQTTGEHVIYNDDPITVQGRTMYCVTGQGHGNETLREGFYRSCNPVFVQVANEIGIDVYYDYIDKLGFTRTSGIDLYGEARGIFHENPMPLDFANLSFGESSTVTPLQLTNFYATIANGGYMHTPRLIGAYESVSEGTYHELPASNPSQIFSESTSRRVLSLLEDAVYLGNSATFGSEGFRLGGKTGTSIDELNDIPTYSFAGVAPVDDPRIVSLVIIRDPGLRSSSVVASRASNRISARVLNYMGLKQNYSARELANLRYSVAIPDLSGLTVGEAAAKLSAVGLAPSVPIEQFYLDKPLAQILPAEGSILAKGSTVWLYPEQLNEVEWVTVPDFRAKNYHESVWLAAEAELVIQVVGEIEGLCVDQSPESSSATDNVSDVSGAPNGTENNEKAMVPKGTAIKLSFADDVNVEETEPVVYTPPVVTDPEPQSESENELAEPEAELDPETDPLP